MKGRKNLADKPAGIVRNRTFAMLVVCGVAAFMALGVKLFTLQVVDHDKYEAKAISQQMRNSVLKASRGTIYDRNGKPLAVSATAETVYIDPYLLAKNSEDKVAIAVNLENLLDVDQDDIIEKFSNESLRGLPIKRKIEAEEAEPVRQYISDNQLTSVYLSEDTKRYYPQSRLASNVIGFVGTDNYGLEGLEAKYDEYLTGTDGRIVRLKNVSGTDMLFSDYENYFDPQNGNDTTLTLDATIQYYVEKHLSQAIEDFKVEKGAACIAVNPKNNEVLAMASYNNYDLNAPFDISDEINQILNEIEETEERTTARAEAWQTQWRNKAISDTYEPGSVFKIITLAMALEENLVNEHSTFYCNGSIAVPGRKPVNCWKSGGHGSQTLSEVVQNSCNVAFVNIGFRVGAPTFYKYIESFGLFDKTGIDLPGEAGSIWWSPDIFTNPKNNTELAAASFGQTFNITPMQLVTAISATVNGGYLYEPHLVMKITDKDGSIVKAADPRPLRQALSKSTSDEIREILEAVVSEGTGKNAYVKGYRVGGKTGTSQKIAQEATTEIKEYIVSFCGIAPMDDPQIVILVMLDAPANTGVYVSGGVMAAPVVGNMLSDILPYMGVTPEYTEEEAKELNATVPKLMDKTREDAKSSLDNLGLNYEFVGEGNIVTDQLPSPHAVVSPGTKVIVYMGGSKPDNENVLVPALMGKTYNEAKRLLENAGLFIRSAGVPSSTSEAVVSIQSASVGSELAYGSVVEVTLVDKSIQGMY